LSVTDELGRIAIENVYDMTGRELRRLSMDAGERMTLRNSAGLPIREWDGRGNTFRYVYDSLNRITHLYVTEGGEERLSERLVYGETHPEGDVLNLRGRLHLHFDSVC